MWRGYSGIAVYRIRWQPQCSGLVGTYAFLVFDEILSTRWGDASCTGDVDFAHAGKSLSIVSPGNFTTAVPLGNKDRLPTSKLR